jgi:gentisate 1,2-dioxygenase
MDIVHASDVPTRQVSGHRDGDIKFQRMLQGDPAGLDNFELSLVHNRGRYYTPRHRHNFEQIRMVVSGEFSFATRKTMKTGQVGFFPEGTYYGPQNVTDCTMLTLQCGGPSLQGFLSYDQLHAGHLEMKKLGRFEGGVFYRGKGSNHPKGKKNQDGYEAIWEHVRGRSLAYPKARYTEPVIMTPAAIDWQDTSTRGVQRKLLGIFDRGVRCEMLKLEAGAATMIDAPRAVQLLFVNAGEGRSEDKTYRLHSAIRVAIGERATLRAEKPTELLIMGMAEIVAASAAARAA